MEIKAIEPGFKACPYCGEPIREAATVCRYCQRILAGRPTNAKAYLVGGALIGGLIVAFIILVMVKRAHDNPQPLVSTPPTQEQVPPPPPPPPKRVINSLLSGNIVVAAQHITTISFVIPDDAQRPTVVGSFHAFGGSGNDIEATIMTLSAFENWSNGHEAKVFYDSGKITNGEINISGIPAGEYILAFSNKFSGISKKEVTGQVTVSYTVLP